jgi:cysteine desulfurase
VRIYLDWNASAPILPEAADAMSRALRELPGNASSVHYFGQQSKAAVDEARSAVARLIGGEPGDIVFTGGGTESDNLALRGAAEPLDATLRRHLVTSAIEHEAVLNTAKTLAKRGWSVTWLPVAGSGAVDPDALRQALTPATSIVSVMHANNEVGTIQPIAELARIAREHGALFHTDAVQSAGKIPIRVAELGIDLLSISAHKMGGPKGVGALWVRRGVSMQPAMTGGRQERGRRAGTENVPAIVGFGIAAAAAANAAAGAHGSRIAALRDRLEQALLGRVAGAAVNGGPALRVPNTTNISFAGAEAETVLIALDLEGIAVSTGSACSSGTLEPSHVLRAMGLPPSRVQSAIRFSLGIDTTEAEIDAVVGAVPRVLDRIRGLSRKGGRS